MSLPNPYLEHTCLILCRMLAGMGWEGSKADPDRPIFRWEARKIGALAPERSSGQVKANTRPPPSRTAREHLFRTSHFPFGSMLGRAAALLALDGPSRKGVPERFAFGAAGLRPPLQNRAQGCALSPGQARTISLRLPPRHSPAPAGSQTTPILAP